MHLKRVNIRSTHWELDESNFEVLHADEPHALVMAAGYLKFKHASSDSEGIYFRGQRKLYGQLVPSLFRGLTNQKTQERNITALTDAINEFKNAGSIFASFGEYAHEPLLQHYGINTTWIDLVDNVWVALWFACHRAISAGKNSQYLHFQKRVPNNAEQYAYVLLVASDIVRRNRNKPGYFSGERTEMVDLRMAAPSVFLRPHAQHGLLFRMRGVDGNGRPTDYAEQIRGVIRVNLSDALNWLGDGKMVGTHALFPPPYYDSGYEILLSCQVAGKRNVGRVFHVGA